MVDKNILEKKLADAKEYTVTKKLLTAQDLKEILGVKYVSIGNNGIFVEE